jgi:NRAMP (natural resistance-associated macrophage protein)-like metal ion transporter
MRDDARRLAPPGSVTLREPPEGEIRGALGTIRPDDVAPRRSLGRRLLTLLAIMGPGLVVMIGDNDAGGVTTYAQAGQAYGTSLLWTLLLLIPVLVVAQEMVARLGAVTGVGHARLIRERFGRFWAAFSVVDLFVLNALTLMTEFIGIDLGLRYFGVSDYLSVPLAAVGMVAVAASGSFRRWERSMLVLIVLSLLMYPLAALSRPRLGPVLHGLFVPSVAGGWTGSAVLFVIAIVGTTVAPWQLFFQQSNVIDKRITTRWLRYEVAETVIGGFLTNIGAAALVVAAAFAFAGTRLAGQQSSGLGLAEGFAHTLGHAAGALFAIILIDAALIGGSAVTLSSAYAFADLFGIRHSLHRRVREAKGFYVTYAAMVAVSAGVVLVPHAPLGLINLGVQVLAGTLLPSAIVFLLLLANDPAVLGPYVNTPRQNVVASVIVAVLVLLSLILTVTSLLPSLPIGPVCAVLAALTAGGLAVVGIGARRQPERLVVREALRALDRTSWRMPPIKTLPPLVWSPTRKLAMFALRAYLVLAAVAMVVKVIELAH